MRAIRPVRTRVATFAACVLALVSACKGEDGLPPGITLEFVTDTASPHYGSVEAWPVGKWTGMPQQYLATILKVTVGDTLGMSMLGTYSIDGNTLRFRPRFAPKPGALYFARWEGGTASWRVPADTGPASTVVTAVYPSADVLPVNLLRMYVEFSAPMTTGRALEYLRLYAGDSIVDEPFYSAGGAVELWDPDKRRLTVLFDPGRIKRDLKPNEQLGLPLRDGGRYRLVVDSAWPDAAGRPLRRGHVKAFRVRGMERTLVLPSEWKLTVPRAGSRDSLIVVFPKPLDFALLQRMMPLKLSYEDVPGRVVVSAQERRWAFAPDSAWQMRNYRIDIDNDIEDVAGNSVKRLFDVRPGDVVGTRATRTRIAFMPR